MKYVAALAVFMFAARLFAAEPPATFTYQGKLFKANGVDPVVANSVSFNVQIRSPDGLCLLFEETHLRDMSGTAGVFALNIGEGSSTGAASLNLKQVFDNGTVKVGAASCNYTPMPGDIRRLRFSYNDGTGAVALPNDQTIRSVPYAMNSIALQGMGKDQFIQVNATTNQTKVDALTGYVTELSALAGGTSDVYVKASDLNISGGVVNLTGGGVSVSDSPTSATYAINRNYADNRIGGQVIDFSGLSNGQSIVWNSTTNKWVSRSLASSDLPTPGGDVGGTYAAQIVQRIQGVTISTNAPTANQVLSYNASTLKWEPKSATSLYSFVSGGGITITSGTGAVTIGLASGYSAGQSLNWNGSAWSAGYLNAANLRGQGLAAQFPTNCDSGETLTYQAAFDTYACTNIVINASQITGSVAGGDMTGSMGAMTVSKIRGVTIAATAPTNLQFLRYNSASTQWEPTSVSLSSGSVTSVVAGTGLTGGTISTSGTLGIDFGTTAGTVAQGNDPRIVGALQSTSSPGGDMSGSMGAMTVTKIRGVTVSATSPSNLQFMRYNSSTTQWEPTTVALNSGTVTGVTAGTGLTGGTISTSGTLGVDFGTTAGTVAQGNDSRIVNALQPSTVPGGDMSGTMAALTVTKIRGVTVAATSPSNLQFLRYNSSTSQWEPTTVSLNAGTVTSITAGNGLLGGAITTSGAISIDVGTTANKIVQLDSSARLPAVDGSQLSNLPIPFTNMRVFDSAGNTTWTPPAAGTRVYVQLWGAGGGGAGGSNALSGGGSGGGGGGYAMGVVTVSGALTVTVGAGGAKGIVNTAGSAGGSSTFGGLITAGGGAGGAVNTAVLTVGGTAGGVLGVVGGLGLVNLGSQGGNGGPAAAGGAFGGPGAVSATVGTDGAAPGGGGGGGYGALLNGKDGGTGAAGRVLIWY